MVCHGGCVARSATSTLVHVSPVVSDIVLDSSVVDGVNEGVVEGGWSDTGMPSHVSAGK